MSTSDVLSIVALVLSLVTFYWTALRKGRLVTSAPTVVAFIRWKTGRPGLGTTLLITNDGPRPVQINFLSATLSWRGEVYHFHCVAEAAFRNALELREITQETAPQAFTVPPLGAVTKHVVFGGRDITDFPVGEFAVSFVADLVDTRDPVVLTTRNVIMRTALSEGRFVEGIALRKFDKLDLP